MESGGVAARVDMYVHRCAIDIVWHYFVPIWGREKFVAALVAVTGRGRPAEGRET